MAAALVNETKEGQQVRPSPIPLIHCVWVTASISSQPVIQPAHGVKVRVDGVNRKQATVFRKEHEYQS
jgi:hypothetical protein